MKELHVFIIILKYRDNEKVELLAEENKDENPKALQQFE